MTTEQQKKIEADYEPFGPEWEKEMMKWTKPAMIDHLKTVLKERLNTDALIAEKDKEIERLQEWHETHSKTKAIDGNRLSINLYVRY